MPSIISFDRHLSETQRALNAVRHLGTPESNKQMKAETQQRAEDLALDDLAEGVCFAKIPWGSGDRHYLWSALMTRDHSDGGGLYGAARTTMAMVEYFENTETAPRDRSTALKLVDRGTFARAEVYEGPDPWALFDDVFAGFPAFLERKLAEPYDTLMCLRAVEAFRRHPFDPQDTVGLHRLIKFLEDRRRTMRETRSSGLHVGVEFGAPMMD